MNCYASFFMTKSKFILTPCHFQCVKKPHMLAGVLVPWDSMPEALKFTTFLSHPLAIHPIQVHGCRKPGVVSIVSLLLWFLVFLSRSRKSRYFKQGTKPQLSFQLRFVSWRKGGPSCLQRNRQSWNEFLLYSFGWGVVRGKSPAEQKWLERFTDEGPFHRWESLGKCRLQTLKLGGAWPDSLGIATRK